MNHEQLSFDVLLATKCTQDDVTRLSEVRKERLEIIKQRHKAMHKGQR